MLVAKLGVKKLCEYENAKVTLILVRLVGMEDTQYPTNHTINKDCKIWLSLELHKLRACKCTNL